VCLKVNQHLYTYSCCNGIARQHSYQLNAVWGPKNSPSEATPARVMGLGTLKNVILDYSLITTQNLVVLCDTL